MNQSLVIILLVAAVIVLGGLLFFQRHRSEQLRSRFGPEYDREVKDSGDKSKAEAKLLEREKRVKSLSIRPLEASDRVRFTQSWQKVQAEFVDDPERSIGHADALLAEVMSARGYPVSDFEQMSADVSVDHPHVVQNYRAAHEIALRHEQGKANTEDLRQAMIHYRSLFEELVNDAGAADTSAIKLDKPRSSRADTATTEAPARSRSKSDERAR
jgi:hypothetical protein